MRLSPVLIASLSLLGACSPDVTEPLRPSMSQLRYGLVEITPEEMPILPEARHIIGVVINGEEIPGYSDAPPLKLTDQQMTLFKDLDDPLALEKHRENTYTWSGGDLFDENTDEGTLTYTDVEQGAIGDCYFAAALSSILYVDHQNDVRQGLIRKLTDTDGEAVSFAVRFYDAWGVPQDIEVDADLTRSNSGNPLYIRSLDSSKGNEEWGISLIEKAYAQWHGGFEEIGNGGSPGDVLQALSGSNSTYRRIASVSDSSLFTTIRDSQEALRPVVAGTFGEDAGVDYEGTFIYASHAYSVLGISKEIVDEKERVLIQLRNPWGSVEPPGNGVDDGIFEIDLPTFRRLYSSLSIGGGLYSDHNPPNVLRDLSVVESYNNTAVIEFIATGDDGGRGLAARYDVRVANEPITAASFYTATSIPIASPQAPGSLERFEITDLQPGVTYYVAVRAEDESGNISSLSKVIDFTLQPPDSSEGQSISVNTFEGASDAYHTSGIANLTTRWSVSPDHSIGFNFPETGDYNNGQRVLGQLSMSVDFLDPAFSVLKWDQKLSVEASGDYDMAWFSVIVDGEKSQIWDKSMNLSDGSKETVSVDLQDYIGKKLTFLWSFDSVDEIDNEYEGWYIDDVRLSAARDRP